MTVLPVGRTYGQKKTNDLTFEKFQQFSDLEEKRKRCDSQVVKCSEECKKRIAEIHKVYIANETKLQKEIKELRETIKQLEQERKGFLEAQQTKIILFTKSC